jgi:uncharacterized protein YuzE
MTERYLEVTYQNGKALAAYLYLPLAPGAKSARTAKAGAGLLVDYAEGGEAIGLEITAPAQVTVEQINVVLHALGQPGIEPGELAPLRAA